VISVGRVGPLQGLLAYAAAVLWAFAGVVVNHYDASLLTTGARCFLSCWWRWPSSGHFAEDARTSELVGGACDLAPREPSADGFFRRMSSSRG
jgi:hypothetical protein